MPEAEYPIRIFRRIILMCFLVFSLSPCPVKEGLAHSVIADYSKPLNKTKTTNPISSCSYLQHINQSIQRLKKVKTDRIEPFTLFVVSFVEQPVAKVCSICSTSFSVNSPPRYILYKRLKVDAA